MPVRPRFLKSNNRQLSHISESARLWAAHRFQGAGGDRHPFSVEVVVSDFSHLKCGPGQMESAPISGDIVKPSAHQPSAHRKVFEECRWKASARRLVFHCFVDGRIMRDPGDIDGDGISVIPVKILETGKQNRRQLLGVGFPAIYLCLRGAS
jgi:hypothetical protein